MTPLSYQDDWEKFGDDGLVALLRTRRALTGARAR